MRVGAVIWAFVLHIAALLALIVVLPWRVDRLPAAAMAVPIQGVIIDQAAIEREKTKLEAAARQERQQQQREERQRREAAEQQRLADQREKQRVADEQRSRDDAKRKEEQRLADERAEQARKKEEAEAQARRDRAAQKQREEEMQLAAAAEAEANAARAAGLLDQYQLMIQTHVKRYWNPPLSARPGIECVVNVVQLPTGDVVSAKVAQCNGDEAVRRSIENAVLAASPLPRPPSQAVFSRTFTLTFAPDK